MREEENSDHLERSPILVQLYSIIKLLLWLTVVYQHSGEALFSKNALNSNVVDEHVVMVTVFILPSLVRVSNNVP